MLWCRLGFMSTGSALRVAALVIAMSGVGPAAAQGTFFKTPPPTTPTTTPTTPPAKPAPKTISKHARNVGRKAALSKTQFAPAATSVGNSSQIVAPERTPAEPAWPSPLVVGSLEGINDSATIRIAGHIIELHGLEHAPANDESKKLISWVEQNGGQVQCWQDHGTRSCETVPTDLNLGLALIVNGAASPTPDASEAYKVAGAAEQLRTAALKNNPSTAFMSMLAGSIVLDCEIGCTFQIYMGGYKRNNALFEQQDWAGLVDSIYANKLGMDIDYYFLGRAAEAYGAYRAAAHYYQKAAEFNASNFEPKHCLQSRLDMCGGVDLPSELGARIERTSALASYLFD